MEQIKNGETRTIEFKREYSRTILKTVSAFSNYYDGQIIIGIDDSLKVVGVEDPVSAKLTIENAINDNITPKPYFEITDDIIENKKILILKVFSGENTPYVYNGKAYRRLDTSTIAVDKNEYENLILKGRNLSYDSLIYDGEDLEFHYLNKLVRDKLDIGILSDDIMKTLELISNNKYNIAAALLSDKNPISNSRISLIRFEDEYKLNIKDRVYLKNISIIEQYDKSIEFFNKHINIKEIIQGAYRKTIEEVPLVAFREALANAIVHREYMLDSHIRVEIFDDRIEIISPGGLPPGISEEEYLDGRISIPRNIIITNIFFRLGIIERLATGIRRIKGYYKSYNVNPEFQVLANSIRVVLPKAISDRSLINESDESFAYERMNERTNELSHIEITLLKKMEAMDSISRKQAEDIVGLKKTGTVQILNNLVNKGFIIRVGRGKDTIYKLL
ncbi:MAG: AAA family ATPase [Tissierellia bacterium]|nr:AAA family ATPase [Tissierellia bacterium]